jgi:RNA polymerase sigma factor, sigma-70 family
MNPISISLPYCQPVFPRLRELIDVLFSIMSAGEKNETDGIRTIAYERIIEEHRGLITKICYYYSSSVQEFEDLRQDVCINIWRGLDTFRTESRQSTWIYRICLNTCISSWRKNSRHKNSQTLESIVEPSECDGEGKEEMETLHFLISLLSPEEKALIMLWLDEKSYDEISDVTGFNRNTVATKLRRIKDKLAANAKKYELD